MGQVATHFKDAGTLRLLPSGGGMQRAVKSRKQFHRVVIETPPMHRHTLESHREDLWRATRAEFKFVRSSFAKSDMGFFEGFPPNRPQSSEAVTGMSLVRWSRCLFQARRSPSVTDGSRCLSLSSFSQGLMPSLFEASYSADSLL